VGDAQVTVVEAATWAAAFGRLTQAGLPVALAGRTLRLPGISPAEAERALTSPPAAATGEAGPAGYRGYSAPAPPEERVFELASPARAAEQKPGVPACPRRGAPRLPARAGGPCALAGGQGTAGQERRSCRPPGRSSASAATTAPPSGASPPPPG